MLPAIVSLRGISTTYLFSSPCFVPALSCSRFLPPFTILAPSPAPRPYRLPASSATLISSPGTGHPRSPSLTAAPFRPPDRRGLSRNNVQAIAPPERWGGQLGIGGFSPRRGEGDGGGIAPVSLPDRGDRGFWGDGARPACILSDLTR